MTSEELEKSIQEIWEMFKETDRKFKETEKRFRETDKKIERVSAIVGDLGGKWGQFVEGLVVPTVKELFQERGIPVERVYRHIEATRNGRHFEGDILLTNKTYAVLVEVKSTLTVEDVNTHIDRLGEFKEFFPEYAHLKLMGAVAAIVFHEKADRYAYKKGLFVLAQRGDAMVIVSPLTPHHSPFTILH